jgi:hypothetical protein
LLHLVGFSHLSQKEREFGGKKARKYERLGEGEPM